ncbi:MAG: hypothetical protein HC889_06400 [Synechococcaceae cyanobacterium SM1_2_3]|nr:hypothetical protein [Synechococcaceae cyanobacterium SM1_2_3]
MYHCRSSKYRWGLASLFLGLLTILAPVAQATVDIANQPLFVGGGGKPLSLLVMGRDHKLYYEAYNDASDLNQDGEIDVGYKPNLTQDNKPLNYFGYFDSYKCYSNAGLPGVTVFTPISPATNKKCSNSWSGDFLNYLTTSRIDALRRVLYGGYRVSDTASATILERARIPQDAHSWGKEYESIARDGYDIREYAPLNLPATGTRHLFANVTLKNDSDQKSLLRVLTNSNYRIWNWVAIERPVAGDKCINQSTNCETAGSSSWEIVPSAYLSLTQTTYKKTGSNPNSASEFNTLVTNFATTANRCGSQSVSTINGSGNPFNGTNDCADINYLTIFDGQITIPTTGTYKFSVDGNDAVDLTINGTVVASYYGGHSKCNCNDNWGSVTLTAGTHSIRFRHEQGNGTSEYYLKWERTVPASVRTDYQVRVKACVSGLLEPECKGYPEGSPTVYKPTGLLHEYGETDRMAFGLLTGSFKNNLSGGVLRKNVGSFTDEVNANTGQFVVPATTGSIVDAISKMRIVGFQGDYYYNDGPDKNKCGVPMVTAMKEGRCAMWGNPVAEMMYEGLRYFAGKTSTTSDYDFTDEFSWFVDADKLALPKPAWVDPYRTTAGGYPYCSKPFEIVIADAPSFDSDQLPGASFGSSGLTSDIGSLNVTTLGQTIWNGELGGSKNIFIGQSNSNDPTYDTAPTPKTVTSFGNIRGLAPEEPTREGSYYAASVAHFGKVTGVRTIVPSPGVSHVVKTDTFGISLSSPLPTIAIPVPNYTDANKKIITVVPFAKSVKQDSKISAAKGDFQPTNTIVDFFIEAIANTGAGNSGANCPSTVPADSAGQACNGGRPYIKFAINYEDSEYGSDHDMDAIVTYTMKVNASDQLEVNLVSNYEAGGVLHHIGYVISGTTKDGVYMEVRDWNAAGNSGDPGSDVNYFLDTPPEFTGTPPAPDSGTGTWADGVTLPKITTRIFSPATTGTVGATFIPHDPLWYAAKWGGFIDTDGDNKPNLKPEWDKNNDGKPDTYFLVTNAGKLKEQLSATFNEIIKRTSSAAAVAVNSSSLIAGGRIYQARFESGDWTGELRALEVNPISGAPGTEVWDASTQLNGQNFNTGRQIITYKPGSDGIPFRWPGAEASALDLHLTQTAALNGSDSKGEARLNWLRGDAANEEPAGNLYRSRTISATRNVLGDIVNSNPFYVGRPDAGYTFSGYSTFANTYKNRRPMVYIGANDGMLHGFDAKTGKEVFAYVPNAIFSKLNALTEQTYIKQHQYYVDGSPTVIDVYVGDAWRTVLVSGLRAGGNSYFALDVTDPGTIDPITGDLTNSGSLTEANAAGVVMWEFTDPDLGLTFSQPSVVKLSDGTWVTVFGNGYNSKNPAKPETTPVTPATTAVLFVIDVATGGATFKRRSISVKARACPRPRSLMAMATAWPTSFMQATWKETCGGSISGIPIPQSGLAPNCSPPKTQLAAIPSRSQPRHKSPGIR